MNNSHANLYRRPTLKEAALQKKEKGKTRKHSFLALGCARDKTFKIGRKTAFVALFKNTPLILGEFQRRWMVLRLFALILGEFQRGFQFQAFFDE